MTSLLTAITSTILTFWTYFTNVWALTETLSVYAYLGYLSLCLALSLCLFVWRCLHVCLFVWLNWCHCQRTTEQIRCSVEIEREEIEVDKGRPTWCRLRPPPPSVYAWHGGPSLAVVALYPPVQASSYVYRSRWSLSCPQCLYYLKYASTHYDYGLCWATAF